MHRHKRPQRKTEKGNRQIKNPVRDSRKPALTNGDAQIILIRRMVNDVKIPEEANLVANAMKPVVGEIINEKQNQPRPSNIHRHLNGREFINPKINQTRRQTEKRAPRDAHKTDEDIRPGIFAVKVFAVLAYHQIRFDGNQKRENRNGDDGWI